MPTLGPPRHPGYEGTGEGTVRAALLVAEDGSRLGLFDKKGKPAAALNATEDGSRLVLGDATGKPRAGLSVDAGGEPALILSDEAGKPIWTAP